jgi:hypothetical protein
MKNFKETYHKSNRGKACKEKCLTWCVPLLQEERRRTGRYVAVTLVVIACLLGLHHAFVKQNVVLAGLIVPALIMVFYILWVLRTAKKAIGKHADFEASYFCTRFTLIWEYLVSSDDMSFFSSFPTRALWSDRDLSGMVFRFRHEGKLFSYGRSASSFTRGE